MFEKFNGHLYGLKKSAEGAGLRVRDEADMERLAHADLQATGERGGMLWHVMRELFHYGLNHKTYYVPSELAKGLIGSDYELTLEDLRAIRFPYASFEIAVQPFRHEGMLVGPSLVVPPTSDSSTRAFWQVYSRAADALGIPSAQRMYQNHMTHVQMPKNISVAYYADGNRYYSCVDLEKDAGKDLEDALGEALSRSGASRLLPIALPQFKLALGVMLYAGIEDAERRPMSQQVARAFGTEDGEVLGEGFRRGPSWHLRRGCFHVLSHPRWRRNPDGTPRRVWHRGCEVAKKEDPAFPKEKKEELAV
jgi:hypothetical protein